MSKTKIECRPCRVNKKTGEKTVQVRSYTRTTPKRINKTCGESVSTFIDFWRKTHANLWATKL